MRGVGRMSMLTTMVAVMLSGDPVLGDGDMNDLCSIQDWTYRHVAKRERLYIEGRATCESGEMTVFAYTGPADTRQYLGADRVRIRDFTFKARIRPVHNEPEALVIEYMVLE